MAEELTDVDLLLLRRWADTTGLREAIKELEERLGDRLEAVAERLRPWLDARGYMLLDVDRKLAAVNVVKPAWVNKQDDPSIFITVAALFPYGYRRVEEEHAYVWIHSDYLSKEDQQVFQAELSERLKNRPEEWLNEDCERNTPAGRYIRSHGDVERALLAQSEEAMEGFIKAEIEPLLALGPELDSALHAVKGAS